MNASAALAAQSKTNQPPRLCPPVTWRPRPPHPQQVARPPPRPLPAAPGAAAARQARRSGSGQTAPPPTCSPQVGS